MRYYEEDVVDYESYWRAVVGDRTVDEVVDDLGDICENAEEMAEWLENFEWGALLVTGEAAPTTDSDPFFPPAEWAEFRVRATQEISEAFALVHGGKKGSRT